MFTSVLRTTKLLYLNEKTTEILDFNGNSKQKSFIVRGKKL